MDNKALIVGNGFSINFDRSFSNIYGMLEEGKNYVIRQGEFKISPGAYKDTKKALKTNYNKILSYVRNMNQVKLENIFIDILVFADFIINTPSVYKKIEDSKHNHKNNVAPNMLEITEKMLEVGKAKGVKYINIENWPVLFWLYNLVDRSPEFKEFSKKPNIFITLMKLGETIPIGDKSDNAVMVRTRLNGFAIFYRLLMISIVFNFGKSVDVNKLDNLNDINTQKLKDWFEEFKLLFTLNYDLILETLSDRTAIHLHGGFSENWKGDFYYHSYALSNEGKKYYTNDILLGDYISTKVLDGFIHKLVMSNQAFSIQMKDSVEVLQTNLESNHINHIVIFGVHPENDYHILSGIYNYFYKNKVESPTITYCYYDEEAKAAFQQTWANVIVKNYIKTIDYVQSISLNYVDSKHLIHEHFY